VADFTFNISKGAVAEKIRDGATACGMLLLKAAEADATLKDRDDLAAILANGSTEADFTNYARKTGLTGSITVDDTNDRVDVDIPDQTWTSAGGASNNTLTDLIIYYQESAADSGRVPLVCLDFPVTTDGSDLTVQINASGFYRAS
jgi:hypothetical protein